MSNLTVGGSSPPDPPVASDDMPWQLRVLDALARFPDGTNIAGLTRPLADGTRHYDSLYRAIHRTLRILESHGHAQRAGHARPSPLLRLGPATTARTPYRGPVIWQITAEGASHLARQADGHLS